MTVMGSSDALAQNHEAEHRRERDERKHDHSERQHEGHLSTQGQSRRHEWFHASTTMTTNVTASSHPMTVHGQTGALMKRLSFSM